MSNRPNALKWQVFAYRLVGALAPRGSRTVERFKPDGRLRLGHGKRLLQIIPDKFELVDPGAALRVRIATRKFRTGKQRFVPAANVRMHLPVFLDSCTLADRAEVL